MKPTQQLLRRTPHSALKEYIMPANAATLRNAAATIALTALSGAANAQDFSTVAPASEASPLAVLQTILSNPSDLDFVKQYTTDDFTYVSLNYENPELKQIMPWAGTTKGTEGLVQTFIDVSRYWTVDDFQIQDSFENENGAALFGTFTYTSNTLGKTVTSPFAVLARGENGKLSYVQFMEDTFATVRSFRESGEYRIKANPDE
ncbi:nuclear transport factor 2 family protein [Roseovarius sp. B08]|uniref:nuclear transport factor 2 family protein n=1 Tax=Roseovarius sp. B08 TaxID=3449223 RepID=UPI003EDC45B8